MNQASAAQLDLGSTERPTDPTPLGMRFWRFHLENPQVYRRLRELAIEKLAKRKARGKSAKVGIKGLWERLRWDEDDLPLTGEEGPKLDNSLVSQYARLLKEKEPELRNAIEIREGYKGQTQNGE